MIVAIDGEVIGGGIEFCLGADLRIATVDSKFHFKQTQVGLPTGFGGTKLLCDLLGQSRAAGYLLLNRIIDAHEAVRDGLIHETVTNSSEMRTRLEELGYHFSQQSPEALLGLKRMLYLNEERNADRYDQELELLQIPGKTLTTKNS